MTDEKRNDEAVTLLRSASKEGPVRRERIRMDDREPETVLELLIRAKGASLPDLAFRYGCRNRRCGLCAVEVNGTARLACAAKVRGGERIGPLRSLPRVRDLVVDRRGVERLLAEKRAQLQRRGVVADVSPTPSEIELGRCVGCLACLGECPLHMKNMPPAPSEETRMPLFSSCVFRYGSPYVFLHLFGLMGLEDTTREEGLVVAEALGIDACFRCGGCRCVLGIPVFKGVIAPLLERLGDR